MERGKSLYNFISVSIVLSAILLSLALPIVFYAFPWNEGYPDVDATVRFTLESEGEKKHISLKELVIGRSAKALDRISCKEAVKALLMIERNNAIYNYYNGRRSVSEIELKAPGDEKERLSILYDELKYGFILYEDSSVYLPYHVSSYKSTVPSSFFGRELPYLSACETPDPPIYRNICMSYNELYRCLTGYFDLTLSGDCKSWIRSLSVDGLGRVISVNTLMESVDGRAFSDALGLDSTVFTVECLDEKISFTVIGEGDGVGMSLVGAELLAKRGYSCEQIIEHYYKGCGVSFFYR